MGRLKLVVGKTARRLTLYIPLCAVLTLSACDANRKTQSLIDSLGLNPKETLTVVLATYPKSLDWTNTVDRDSSVIESNLMAGLTDVEIKGTEISLVPRLAEKWDVTDTGLKYTFKLKEGVTWSDGAPLKAQQFVDAFKRLLDSASPRSDLLFVLRNAKAYHQHQTKNFSEVGVKAPDDHTLIFELTNSESYFPQVFAHHSLFPVRLDLIEKFKDSWLDPENLATVGPYTLAARQTDRLLVLKRNEKFTVKKAALKNVVLRFNLSGRQALDLFTGGQVNAIVGIPIDDLKLFQDRDDLYFSPLLEVTYLGFDVRQKPFSNPIFRRVVAMAIDRDDVVRALSGAVRPVSSMVPPGLTGFESNRGVRFDPEASKDLQKHSGYSNMDKVGKVFLKTDDSPSSPILHCR